MNTTIGATRVVYGTSALVRVSGVPDSSIGLLATPQPHTTRGDPERGDAPNALIPVTLAVDTGGRLPEPVEVCAYHGVSEALANAARHSTRHRHHGAGHDDR